MAAQVQSTDVFLCYQRLTVSCALCNNFQAARPRQTTERRLAPLYVEHMPSFMQHSFLCRHCIRMHMYTSVHPIYEYAHEFLEMHAIHPLFSKLVNSQIEVVN